jgi:hypothetical protein
MDIDITPYACSASVLAKSLLEVWLSQDGPRLRDELDYLSCMPDLPETDDESDRVDLLKGIASRMKDSSALFTSHPDDPGVHTWLSLLHHLSAADVLAGMSENRSGNTSAI